MRKKAFKAALPMTIPVLTGYLFIGIAFGILANSNGYHLGWILLMSTFIFAGSMQFVAISLLASGFNILSVILITIMINARHLFYGLSMLDRFKNMGKKKPYMIFSLTDETFSLLCGVDPPGGVNKDWFYFYIALLNHIYWILGSLVGGLLGSLITFNTQGIEFVMTALFVVIFLDQWEKNKDHSPAIIGILSSIICLIIFRAENFILPSMILIMTLLLIFKTTIRLEDEQ
ncbi:MAG: branched-chain amino acid ABC transporter permease [Epulopiscium sp.]|nr:branched-chain amino acid ABC transporter permease [Candidatus Epulonipiscium sp.]